jgi:hypothetical protein
MNSFVQSQRVALQLIAIFSLAVLLSDRSFAETIWIEGEKPVQSTMNRHPWWYDQVKRDQFSGGDFISNFNDKKAGEAEYEFKPAKAGHYEFWIRANPIAASMSYRLNGGAWTAIDLDEKKAIDIRNVALDGKPDLRFIAWFKVGTVELPEGKDTIRFRMDSKNSNHGYLDCFVFSNEHFRPNGILKPGEIASAPKIGAEDSKDWFAFNPGEDLQAQPSSIDLRELNEKFAGEGGFIKAHGSRFVHGATGEPVRFWAVNGPPGNLTDRPSLAHCARVLSKYGVNLVRLHAGGYFDAEGNVDPAKVRHAIDVVENMKPEGIYTHLSIYFPLWLSPKPDNKYLTGYDGTKHPFAALYFNKDFQAQYRNWVKALLLTPSPTTGKPLIDEPAVFGIEIINEDSYLFWTFSPSNIPDPELRIIESQFGDWLKKKYGSLERALAAWKGQKDARDNLAEGRIGFRPWWNVFTEKSARDQDTVRFLVESQRRFYDETYKFIRGLGFKGMITASNWTTASPQVLGPLEKYSYAGTDFIDRHGYFDCNGKGDNSGWSIQNGHTYSDRSALRFDPEEPGKPKSFVNSVMDPSYDNKPSMISETTFNRPNRYRSEAPLYYATYGSLQGTDCIVHFAMDGDNWSVKPGYFMQPWTVMTPTMMGQFPAAALIYRKGLVSEGKLLVDLNLKLDDVLNLQGTPLPQDASFDELRLKDVPPGTVPSPTNVIDPLVHFAGRTNVNFTHERLPSGFADLRPYIDRAKRTVTSTTGELKLDYGKGLLVINAPSAQGISGDLNQAGKTQLADLVISSKLPLAHIVAVSLDGQPLATSHRILLQAMTEEKATNFQTESAGDGVKRIDNIGQDPWLVKQISGTVQFKRSDAAELEVLALDHTGYAPTPAGNADSITLRPTTIYYLVRPK